jgi:hypothetical protein
MRLNTPALLVLLVCGLGAGCAAHGNVQPDLTTQDAEPRDDNGQSGGHKSYVLPIVEIVAMDAAFNRVGPLIYDPATFAVTPSTIRRNLRGPWVVDDDPFEVNQFGHPYQGAMYHSMARSNGLGYWASMVYTFAGSAMWEIAGETTPPSFNDQVASGVAGSFLGESLFRISRLALDRSNGNPGVWRKLGAVLASPPTGLNQLMVGTPAGLPSADAVPFSDIRVQFGGTAIAESGTQANVSLDAFQPHFAFSIDYGYPGQAGYHHARPFDYFRFESNVSSEGMEQLSTRGLIAGGDYGAGALAGIWGLYGTYDYFTPDDFRLSTTAFAFGTTLQAGKSDGLTVQGSALVGAGYAAARALAEGNDDYHYGVTPQSLVNLRLIAGRRAALDMTAREYFISGIGGFGTDQRDLIFVGDSSFAVRLVGRHALGLTYQRAGRSTDFLTRPDRTQSRSRVGVFYTFLGSGGFGAVP